MTRRWMRSAKKRTGNGMRSGTRDCVRHGCPGRIAQGASDVCREGQSDSQGGAVRADRRRRRNSAGTPQQHSTGRSRQGPISLERAYELYEQTFVALRSIRFFPTRGSLKPIPGLAAA